MCEVRRIAVLPHCRRPCHSVSVSGHRTCEGIFRCSKSGGSAEVAGMEPLWLAHFLCRMYAATCMRPRVAYRTALPGVCGKRLSASAARPSGQRGGMFWGLNVLRGRHGACFMSNTWFIKSE